MDMEKVIQQNSRFHLLYYTDGKLYSWDIAKIASLKYCDKAVPNNWHSQHELKIKFFHISYNKG